MAKQSYDYADPFSKEGLLQQPAVAQKSDELYAAVKQKNPEALLLIVCIQDKDVYEFTVQSTTYPDKLDEAQKKLFKEGATKAIGFLKEELNNE